MDRTATSLFAAVLLAAAVGWMIWHLRLWRRVELQAVEPREFEFLRRQFLRRMQTSAMLGVLAVALFIGAFITRPPWLVLGYWGAVVLLVFWVALLALADIFASRMHYLRVRDHYTVENIRLEHELRRYVREGEAEFDDPPT